VTAAAPLTLERTCAALGWPAPADILGPKGAGAATYIVLLRAKVGAALTRIVGAPSFRIGVLIPDPDATTTEPPLAIVVEFASPATEESLRELHRLAWNFSHSPTLVTIEPQLLRVWSCCEAPVGGAPITDRAVESVNVAALERSYSLQDSAARSLHWISLVSGEFFTSHASRFNRDGRADQMLLSNLRDIRTRLVDAGLDDDDICHDLIARVIFVQFLFDRKDPDGAAALDAAKLAKLHADHLLGQLYPDFASVLCDYDDTYALFEWLNERFNGDLFPGKGNTPEARIEGWHRERRWVKPAHLKLLADFTRGDLDMLSGQAALWPLYAFDVIPLEFISSIYETFVTERAARDGIFYTPPHLVDFILDRVLPWDRTEWDLKILDPACGSGIFLVKAFQRLVHRWKLAHPGAAPKVETLRRILERNLFGVDKDPHAVRVACFSLYLAMCDEIEPRHYWTQILFPTLRDRRLVCSDFFVEDMKGFGSNNAEGRYDLIIGNAPWGDSLVTAEAVEWAKQATPSWAIANKDIGGLFLAKATLLLKPQGELALIQSANALLFNMSPTAIRFREQLFKRRRITAIYNLSALRFRVFKRKAHTPKRSVSPACVVVIQPGLPALDDRILYASPKSLKLLVDEFTIVMEPRDVRWLSVRDALADRSIWSVLMWGGPRDRVLVDRLRQFTTLNDLRESDVRSSRGIQFGDGEKRVDSLANHVLFDQRMFIGDDPMRFDADSLPRAGTLRLDARMSSDFSAYAYPQLLMKRSWRMATARYEARLASTNHQRNVVCNQSYVSVHGPEPVLNAACLAFNSAITTYFLQLASGRAAAYRPEVLIDEVRNIPLPEPARVKLEGLTSQAEIDVAAFNAFGLNDAERVLVEDLANELICEFRGGTTRLGERTVDALDDGREAVLSEYCRHVMRVIKAGFGSDHVVRATVFSLGAGQKPLPYRLIGLHLCEGGEDAIRIELLESGALLERMEDLDRLANGKRRGFYEGRTLRMYDGRTSEPTIFILKPDARRHWLRSVALEDGDEVALDLFRWQQGALASESLRG
jgi:hypothetical protein